MPSLTGRSQISLDLNDLDGLRGIAAVWIVLFHSFHYSKLWYIDLQGSTLMPLFFLLSGFTLTIGYHKRFTGTTYNTISDITINESNINNNAEFKLSNRDLKRYFYNRCIRVLPVYYICMAIAIPVNLAGWANIDPSNTKQVIGSYITNILPVNTWFILAFGSPFDGPRYI